MKWVLYANNKHFCRMLQSMLLTGGVILLLLLTLKGLAWMIPLPESSLKRPTSTLVFDRNKQLLRAFISSDDMWRIYTPLDEISLHLQRAVICFEDKYFYWHAGIDPIAMARAAYQNICARQVVSGGSTITMQIARMMEPKSRTFPNKVREVFRAFQLELRYSKRQLLEYYFNMAPYGGNIEGAAAAARLYFDKEPSQLSISEAALLAAIPNSPTNFRPDVSSQRAIAARNRVLVRMRKQGVISDAEYIEALREEAPEKRVRLPLKAPHFSRDLLKDNRGKARLISTLDSRFQATAEDLLRIHLNKLRNEGITNGAIVILDNKSRDILALVGSGDFHDRRSAGQVNGALAPRSPGSTLKPFIYALALKEGMISPGHYLEDVPTDFSGYAPENFDRSYSGVVSARVALERSLNLPAVSLENALGEQGLYYLLEQIGASNLRPRDNYGLSMAIGGCEINLLELTALYAALANGGEYIRPCWLREESHSVAVSILDPGTSYIITDILTGLRRPDLPTCWEFTSLPRVAWKTGTSYGHRDAWSIGYNPRYTVGVWLGNFSGEGARNLVGAEVATPILFELMNSICRGKQIPWFKQPKNVEIRLVCSLSGQLPGEHCPTLVEEIFLTDRSPYKTCEFHQAIEIDDQTGYRLPPHYTGDRKSHQEIFVQWPPRVGSWMEKSGSPVKRPPPLLPEWQGLLPGTPPIIRSPSMDCNYRLREGIPAQFQKICFEASVASDAQKLYWFVDGIFVGEARPGERLFYMPIIGRHRVVCQDNLGRSTDFVLVIEDEK